MDQRQSDRNLLRRRPAVSAGAVQPGNDPELQLRLDPRAGKSILKGNTPMQTTRTCRARRVACAAAIHAILVVFVACESEATAPELVFEEGMIAIDASSPIAPAYVNLDDVAIVTPSDPDTSTDWHMAFRRFSIRLNGGVAGPGSVSGLNLGNNANMSADEVTAMTEQDGIAAFQAVTDAHIPTSSSFMVDGLAPDPGASWFRFDFRTGVLVANPGAAWKLRESSGRGFGIFRVTALEMEGERPVGATFEFRRHAPGGTLGAAETLSADLRRGPVFFSLANGLAMSPAGCGWDLAATPDLSIEVNADCGAGTFPLDVAEDFTALSQAGDAPEYGAFLSTVSGAFPATVDDASGFFWYDIQENSRMWPTYNVFLVQAGEQVYKVQITDYYDAGGNSGHPTLRYQRLR